MSDDRTFQIALLVGFLGVFPIALYYRIRAHFPGEHLDRRQEGLFILFTLRPAGLLFMFSLLAYAIDPGWLAWSSVALPRGLRWIGVIVYAVAGGTFLWTLRTLGHNLTDTVVTRRTATLVTGGPYRWVRHPFYVSVAILGIGASLAAASWFLPLVGATFLSLIVLRTRIEEEKLMARFGDDYRTYMAQTGRFWPKIGAKGRGA